MMMATARWATTKTMMAMAQWATGDKVNLALLRLRQGWAADESAAAVAEGGQWRLLRPARVGVGRWPVGSRLTGNKDGDGLTGDDGRRQTRTNGQRWYDGRRPTRTTMAKVRQRWHGDEQRRLALLDVDNDKSSRYIEDHDVDGDSSMGGNDGNGAKGYAWWQGWDGRDGVWFPGGRWMPTTMTMNNGWHV
jgi:hypothetical protein